MNIYTSKAMPFGHETVQT